MGGVNLKKRIVSVLFVGLLVVSMSTLIAASSEVTAKFTSFKFLVNGNVQELDASPIVVNGQSYLPVRAVSEMLGYSVNYDGTTRTISLNSKSNVPTTTSQETNEPSQVDTSKLLKTGDVVEYGEWEYKVEKVEFHSTLSGSSFSENIAKGKYVVAIVKFTNKASYERRVGTNFVVKDALGRTFKMDSSASLGHHHAFKTEAWHLDDIGSSFSATIAIAFDVPKDAENLVMYPNENADVQGVLIAENVE
jgi:hypothetical protein